MAEEIAYTIAEWAATYGADLSTVAAIAEYGGAVIQGLAFAGSVYTMRDQQRRAANAQRNAYNAGLKDRYVMVRSNTEPRAVALGRQRVSGPIVYVGSYGAYDEHLVMIVALAAHQIDAVEQVYFDNQLVTLDGSGNVVSVLAQDLYSITTSGATVTLSQAAAVGTVTAIAYYGSTPVTLGVSVAGDNVTVTLTGALSGQTGTVTVSYTPYTSPWVILSASDTTATMTLNSSGNGAITLPVTPVAGSVRVGNWIDFGEAVNDDISAYATVVGSVVTVTGVPLPTSTIGSGGGTVGVAYRDGTVVSLARVKAYLGAPGQAADADMVANLAGVWTSAHTLTGIAYLRVELDYNTDAFPSGIPNVSAQVRGALCYDPRTGATAWSESPPLLMRYVATSPLLGRLPSTAIDDTSIAVAANICDASASYLVAGQAYTRALYTAGLLAKADQPAKTALDDLALAMSGRWVVSDGMLRVRAGAYTTPLQTLDESWLADTNPVVVQGGTNRADLVNVVTGRFCDQQRDYVVADFPRVEATAYITSDGGELPLDMALNAVTFVGQAQQVVGCQIRDLRLGLRLTVTCNMRAYPVQVFDTLIVNLARFGFVGQVFEVLDVSWTLDGGIQLTLKQTDPSIWAMGASFSAASLPANTVFPSPWGVPAITGLTCASGTAQLLLQADGTVQSRVKVTWGAINDALVLADGGVEVRYGKPNDAEALWQSVTADRRQTQCFLTDNIRDGAAYLVKARAFNGLVKGAWCLPILHTVIGKTALPVNVAGLAAAALPGGVGITWTPDAEADYAETELRFGASWGAGTRIFVGPSDRYTWPWPAAGGYTLLAKHRDTSGNESATAASLSVTVGAGNLIDTGSLNPGAATEVHVATPGSSVSVTTARHIPNDFTWQTQVMTVAWTPTVSGVVNVFADLRFNLTSGGASYGFASIQDDNASFDAWKEQQVAIAASGSASLSTTRSFNVTAGVPCSFSLWATRGSLGDTLNIDNAQIRAEQIKR